MPQNRVSTRVMEARGAFERHPERERHDPPSAGPLGDAPDGMGDDEKALWAELEGIMPSGVTEKSDRWSFEVLVRLMAKMRSGKASGSDVSQLTSLLAKFGMTPSDRSRVAGPTAARVDPFAEFLGRPAPLTEGKQ